MARQHLPGPDAWPALPMQIVRAVMIPILCATRVIIKMAVHAVLAQSPARQQALAQHRSRNAVCPVGRHLVTILALERTTVNAVICPEESA